MKPCNDCPFYKKSPLVGSPDWLTDVFNGSLRRDGFKHTCHKTDPNADGYVGGKTRKCVGYLTMRMNEYDNTPGKGGVYRSIRELLAAYLKKWAEDGILEGDLAKKAMKL